jgi:outer membrane protein assembly factor BamA
MSFAYCSRFAPASLLCAVLAGPALTQGLDRTLAPATVSSNVPFSAVVEAIEFKGVSEGTRKLVLDRIGVRPGDILTVAARHRIGRELGNIQKGLTFTYKSGSRRATTKLTISADC